MEIVRGLLNLKDRHRGSVVTIGNFDGVHTGHQAVLSRVNKKSRELGVPSMLICFEPQPREFFDVYNAPARLTRFREKVALLAEHGMDYVLCFKFDEQTRNISAHNFIRMLVEELQVSALFVGDDFSFGQDQQGGFDDLLAAGLAHNFPVTNIYTLVYEQTRVSSTRIRKALAEGDFDLAENLLGHPYSITGKVVYGRQLGRTLGVPTANIQLHRYVAPIAGVFAVETLIGDNPANQRAPNQTTLQGVANVGVRPTLDEATPRPILEVHLFDFDGDIYGKIVKVSFRHKIREEKKFPDLEALKAAIFSDIDQAQQFFSGTTAST